MFARGLLAIVVVVAATLAVAAPSNAAIVVGDNIAGAKPGMTFAQLKKVWGKPSSVMRSGKTLVTADWKRKRLYVQFSTAGTARTVSTQSPKQATPEGIRVGSTAAAVAAAYPTADCDARTCFLYVDAGVSTGFNFTRGKVDSIALVAP